MGENCISFALWMPYALGAAFLFGVLLGGVMKFVIDYAELAAYRALARHNH